MLLFQQPVLRLQPLTHCCEKFFPICHKLWSTNAQRDSYIENILFEKHMGINQFVFPRWQCATHEQGSGSSISLTTFPEEVVFGRLQRRQWLQSFRSLDPWDSWGSDLSQLPIPRRVGSSRLLLCPLPVETVMLLAPMQKTTRKHEVHTDAAAQLLWLKTG